MDYFANMNALVFGLWLASEIFQDIFVLCVVVFFSFFKTSKADTHVK